MLKQVSGNESVESLSRRLAGLREQLIQEQTKREADRLPLFEAELETDIKVAKNEIRRLNGLSPEYSSEL